MKTLILLFMLLPLQSVNTHQVEIIAVDEIIKHETLQEYISFKERLGQLESASEYTVVNKFGYLGKYQFGRDALQDASIKVSKQEFLESKYLQELALYRYLSKNREYLEEEIEKFVGQEINGIVITKASLLAAAHFAGATNVKRFLYNGYNRRDYNGSTTAKYLKEFSSYEFSFTGDIENYIQKTYNYT